MSSMMEKLEWNASANRVRKCKGCEKTIELKENALVINDVYVSPHYQRMFLCTSCAYDIVEFLQ